MNSQVELTVASVHAEVAAGNYSYEQLMIDTLRLIDTHNPSINAIVALVDKQELLTQARDADNTPATTSLHGIPIAIKDLVNVAGITSTFGSPLLKDYVPIKDDFIVECIRDAGAIIIGKTNTPEFGLGSQSYNPVYGTTANPYDLDKTAGGSSGGAAAALASGMLIIADGSDAMGSLRNPAAFCNVYGFRPSYGLVVVEPEGDTFTNQLAVLGPMARTIEDLALLLDVIAQYNKAHPHSQSNTTQFTKALSQPISSKRVAWLGDWGNQLPIESGVLGLCIDALSEFEKNGHTVEAIDAPFELAQLWQAWTVLRSHGIASRMASTYHNEQTRPLLKPEAVFEIETGLQHTVDDIYQASVTRSRWFAKAVKLFEQYDVLVLPSCQVFPFDKTQHWPKSINDQTMTTYHKWMEIVVPASLLGLPALNVPAGFSDAGLPMGIQLIGARGTDAKLLQLGQQYHKATQWPQKKRPTLS